MAKTQKDSASQTVHAFDLIQDRGRELPRGVCVLFGGQRFLKLLVLKHLLRLNAIEGANVGPDDEDDFVNSRFDGSVDWPRVMDELQSQSLFGGGQNKRVVVDDADDFVKNNREKLERLAENGNVMGTLILLVSTWPSNTRLYKFVDKQGLQVQCDIPQIKRGKGVAVDSAKLNKWLIQHALSSHRVRLTPEAASLLCDFTDSDLGRIDSELAKLGLYVDDQEPVTHEHVKQYVGGWRNQTMWEAIDAMMSGKSDAALLLVDRLLKTGEHPLALFGQISWSLRRYPKALEIYGRMKQHEARPSVPDALLKAGFRAWGNETNTAEANMRRLGKARVEQLGDWLLQTDLSLKGSHSRDDRARLALEKLVIWLGQGGNKRPPNAANAP